MKEWKKGDISSYCEIQKHVYRLTLLWEMENNEELNITLIFLVFFK